MSFCGNDHLYILRILIGIKHDTAPNRPSTGPGSQKVPNNSSFLPGFYVLNAGVSFHGSITNPCQVVRYYYHYYLCSTGKKISSYLLSVPH